MIQSLRYLCYLTVRYFDVVHSNSMIGARGFYPQATSLDETDHPCRCFATRSEKDGRAFYEARITRERIRAYEVAPCHGQRRSGSMSPKRLSILYVSHTRLPALRAFGTLMTELARRHDLTAAMLVDERRGR